MTKRKAKAEEAAPQVHVNREDWLAALGEELRPWFDRAGHPLPAAIRFSVSWPDKGGTRSRNRVIGQAWHSESAEDGVPQILVSPIFGKTSLSRVADIIAHELCHIALPKGTGHKAPFKRLAEAVLLEGKPTATYGGDAFQHEIAPILARLGPYPHGALKLGESPAKKQGTRLVKVSCPTCGYVCRVTRKWLDAAGAPICPTDQEPLAETEPEED